MRPPRRSPVFDAPPSDPPDAPVRYFRPAKHRRSGGKRKPSWAVDKVLRLYQTLGSYRNAEREFNRRYASKGMSVCLNTVYTWVRKYRSEAERVRKETRNRFPVFAPANLRWCIDGTGKQDAQGVAHFIFSIIDHGSRLCLVLERIEHANSAELLERITAAVQQFGKPETILSDNASVFRSVEFRNGIAALGIRQKFTPPRKPWMNGRVERFFLTLKQKLNLIVPQDGAALDALLKSFRFWYNAVRPHQHLHGFTPAEVWAGIDPYKIAPRKILRYVEWGGILRGFYQLR
jgi:transposase InsO family protein